MPGKNHGPAIKDDGLYESLRERRDSKEKAARIANARANPDRHSSRKGGKAPAYEDGTRAISTAAPASWTSRAAPT